MSTAIPQFSPRQVALSLSVSESSIKRWCDSGVIPTVRTVGGHRKITLGGLEEFLSATDRVLANPDALGPAAERIRRKAGTRQLDPSDFQNSLAEGDERACLDQLTQKLDQGWSVYRIAETLIVDSMRGVGEAWQCNSLDVYQERRACDICVRLIQYLNQQVGRPGVSAPVAIGAAPETDPYQLPTMLVELTLREVGFNAVSLGNNLPVESLIQAYKDYQPSLVWLSVSAVDDTARMIAEQNKLADSLGEDVALLVGGQALTDDVRPRLRYTAHCDSLRNLAELGAMVIGSSRRKVC